MATPGAPPSLRSLPNLGPASERMLHAAGIHTVDQLRALGAVPAFVAVRQAGQHPSLNLLWALDGALRGRDWKSVAQHERTGLLMQLDDLAADHDRSRQKNLSKNRLQRLMDKREQL